MDFLPTIHHSMLYMLLMRMLTTPHPYPLRVNSPNLIMSMSLNPWERHMKYPEATL